MGAMGPMGQISPTTRIPLMTPHPSKSARHPEILLVASTLLHYIQTGIVLGLR